jgi:hypothetical protein
LGPRWAERRHVAEVVERAREGRVGTGADAGVLFEQLGHQDRAVAEVVEATLTRAGPEVAPKLLAHRWSSSAAYRRALRLMAGFGPEVHPHLRAALASGDLGQQVLAMRVVERQGRMAQPLGDAVAAALPTLSGPPLRRAFRLLGELQPPAAGEALASYLETRDPGTTAAALKALARIPVEQRPPDLSSRVKHLTRDRRRDVAQAACLVVYGDHLPPEGRR